ncbi:DUF368 domain-containing protein, partial [Candidatus Bipolaricaulota bacterium]|nr:DUF368 domain-containing protein [Candidatus Bipolaricaulota bacterium]
MGLASIIPSVSGGTMALITGIYEELIESIESFDPAILIDLLAGRINQFFEGVKRVKYGFLVPVAAGIGVSLLAGSQFIRFLLDNYPPYVYSFFFGLILASAVLLYYEVPELKGSAFLTTSLGAGAAVLVIGVSAGDVSHALPVIFLAGAIAICAMILPGISGALLLLLLGQYEYVLDAVDSLPGSLPVLLVFGLGAAIGIVAFSRVLSFALERWRSETYGFLIGLMIGALRKPFEVLL